MSFYTQQEDYAFPNVAGRPYHPDDLRKRVLYPAMDKASEELKKAGLALIPRKRRKREYGFHIFRHSAGSQMQEATGDLKRTQSFLGHSGIAITGDTYVHLQPDSKVESVRTLEESFFGELCSTVLKQEVSAAVGRAN